jgi:hypothetical protein
MFRWYVGLEELCRNNYTRNIARIYTTFTIGLNGGSSLCISHQAVETL